MENKLKYCEQLIKQKNYKNLSLEEIVRYIRKIKWVSESELEETYFNIVQEIDLKISNDDNAVNKKISNILKTKHVPKDIWNDIWFLKAKDFRNFKSILVYLIEIDSKIESSKIIYYSKLIKESTWLNVHEMWRSYLYNLVPHTKTKIIKKYDECVIFDMEFDMQQGREQIIEIAAIKVKNNKVIGTFSKLIKNNFRVSKKFIDITNIKPYQLKYKNKDTVELREFFKFISNSNVLIGFGIIHNDLPMLKRFDIIKKINLFNLGKYNILDLQDYLAEKKGEQRSLSYYLDDLNINSDDINLHRALDDVSIMYELFLNLDFREIKMDKIEL